MNAILSPEQTDREQLETLIYLQLDIAKNRRIAIERMDMTRTSAYEYRRFMTEHKQALDSAREHLNELTKYGPVTDPLLNQILRFELERIV